MSWEKASMDAMGKLLVSMSKGINECHAKMVYVMLLVKGPLNKCHGQSTLICMDEMAKSLYGCHWKTVLMDVIKKQVLLL